jgi:lipopolysaccharide biosynthesis protein
MTQLLSPNTTFPVSKYPWLVKYLPLNRPQKEAIKNIAFSSVPWFFRNTNSYKKWKTARIFSDETSTIFRLRFWRKTLTKTYQIPIKSSGFTPNLSKEELRLAIAIHAFYPEIFASVLSMIEKDSGSSKIKLYITVPQDKYQEVLEITKNSNITYKIVITENRGRDVLPFLRIIPEILADGNDIILKIHTKNSNHLRRKENWRVDLYEKLIGEGSIKKYLEIFANHPHIGLIGPSDHILPLELYYGANAQRIINICEMLEIPLNNLKQVHFVAGSMFYIRKEILILLNKLNLEEIVFEEEQKQNDGTSAHAFERIFGILMNHSGYALADSDFNPKDQHVKITKSHWFTL